MLMWVWYQEKNKKESQFELKFIESICHMTRDLSLSLFLLKGWRNLQEYDITKCIPFTLCLHLWLLGFGSKYDIEIIDLSISRSPLNRTPSENVQSCFLNQFRRGAIFRFGSFEFVNKNNNWMQEKCIFWCKTPFRTVGSEASWIHYTYLSNTYVIKKIETRVFSR